MLPTRSKLWFFVLFVAVSACANQVQDKEDMLAAAGFTLVPANTPQRQAALKTLPPHKFVHQVRNNGVIFTYADPTICDCLYVGNQAAYDRYRQNVFVKNIADEQADDRADESDGLGPLGAGLVLLGHTGPRTSNPQRRSTSSRLPISTGKSRMSGLAFARHD